MEINAVLMVAGDDDPPLTLGMLPSVLQGCEVLVH
jgi:hypothetical protein